MNNKQNHTRDTETLILEAAEKEFLKKGYDGARTTAIAEAAGVNHAMLHYYFRTKDKLFEKILFEKMKCISDIMLGAIRNSGLSLEKRIQQGIEQHFDFIAANRDLPRFLFNEMHNHPQWLDLIRNNFSNLLEQELRNFQTDIDQNAAEGKCKRVDVQMILMDIVSLNLFPFIAAPIIRTALSILGENDEAFLARRKNENVKTIFAKLEIKPS